MSADIFRQKFPCFMNPPYTDEVLEMYFSWAERVSYASKRCRNKYDVLLLTHLTAAHLITLYPYGESPSVVGRLQSVSQGSVGMSLGYAEGANASASWWLQSQYGAGAWEIIKRNTAFMWAKGRRVRL